MENNKIRMTFQEKYNAAKERNIALPEKILCKDIVGIYGFFAKKDEKETCFYIGKATNMRHRMLLSGGHIFRYLHEDYTRLVPRLMKEYIDDGFSIEVRILEEVDYKDEYFSRAAHRLAFEELKFITQYQKKGECLDQKPEGTGEKEEAYWKANYKR